jgi:TolB protein
LYDVYLQADAGASAARPIWEGGEDKHLLDISPDGRYVLARLYSPVTLDDLYLFTLDGSAPPKPLVVTDGVELDARFSPDGKAIAYSSAREGSSQVYVRGLPDGRSVQVSIDGGIRVQWSADGTQLFFRTMSDVYAVTMNGLQPSKPKLLFPAPPDSYIAYSARSNRFIVVTTNAHDGISMHNYNTSWMSAVQPR